MIHLRPPQPWPASSNKIFLAGSIEMDLAVPWQALVVDQLADTEAVILNPRRLDWDNSLRQTADEPAFREQVLWELNGLEAADTIVIYFDPATKSPVSLLELGLHARSGKLIVCCPEGFWRRGNVMITCERYGIPVFADLDALVQELRIRLSSK